MNPKTRTQVKHLFADRDWRLRNLYYIKDKDGHKVLFVPNAAQEKFLREMHNANIILKARQQGFTTLACILFLDACLFTANLSAGIIAHNLEDANSFFTDKIKFAYDNLPEEIRLVRRANTEKAGELRFNNGSSLRVRTSFRSGTLQMLHISEFGKICAKNPEKAREIVTGALNAIKAGMTVIIESTAEGKIGYFFDFCERARSMERLKQRLTPMDFKFHFFSWWESPEYQTDSTGIIFPENFVKYFKELEESYGIKLTENQEAWFLKKSLVMGEDMGREFPSHPDEAFAQAVDGAYYAKLMAMAETQGRIGNVPHEPLLKVHQQWDLGMNDSMVIWLFQVDRAGNRRYIGVIEGSGEGLEYYVRQLFLLPYNWGKVILPHDARVRELGTGISRIDKLTQLGLRDIVIAPQVSINEGIDAVRALLPKSWFDLAKCGRGIEGMKQYRKAWDDKAGCWKSSPLHDWTSNFADAFRMGALVDCNDYPVSTQKKANNKYR